MKKHEERLKLILRQKQQKPKIRLQLSQLKTTGALTISTATETIKTTTTKVKTISKRNHQAYMIGCSDNQQASHNKPCAKH